ncbi:hypothetical protein [Streptomyces sp. NPDC091215]|uniref:hypothetical protein n=1 Tax=Streptomyces sp. NPDC091215 TaxID=3155192 RepID=UPI00341F63C2
MRRTVPVCLLAVLVLAGCSSSGSTADAKPSPTKTVGKADQYLKTAHGIAFNGTPSDDELLAYPPQWCQGLDAGHSVKWLFDVTGGGGLYPIGEEWGTAQADAYTLLVAGVKAYCPVNSKTVTDELRASGDY